MPTPRVIRRPAPRVDSSNMASVSVFCRIKPNNYLEQCDSCVAVSEDQLSLMVTPPLGCAAGQRGIIAGVRSTFTRVLDDKCSQEDVFDHVALPLIEDLIAGRNGLLFTYGVTGSGKTHTMRGNADSPGLLPRTLDCLFASIGSQLAKKYVVRPDAVNGFIVQSEVDAMLERQRYETMHRILPFTAHNKASTLAAQKDGFCTAQMPVIVSSAVSEDRLFAVFVSLIEIYNNQVVDLLEELPVDSAGRTQPPVIKSLREDARRRMFVIGCTEVECQNAEEAFQAFQKGERRRKVAHTVLNAESSRSHSVFTIRVVQGPVDTLYGDELTQQSDLLVISQLALVDLAGSERTNRTKNVGERLREASSINNSLLTLRKCIEQLRENQMTGIARMVPYRESKLTHLFRNYFDGDGRVNMVLCVNTRSDEYEETIRVLQFAVMTQEVQVPRTVQAPALPVNKPRMQTTATEVLTSSTAQDVLTSSMQPFYFIPFPSTELRDCNDEETLMNLKCYLENRIARRDQFLQVFANCMEILRNRLVAVNERATDAESKIEAAALASRLAAEAQSTQQRAEKRSAERRFQKTESERLAALDDIKRAQEETTRLRSENNRLRLRLQERDFRSQRDVTSLRPPTSTMMTSEYSDLIATAPPSHNSGSGTPARTHRPQTNSRIGVGPATTPRNARVAPINGGSNVQRLRQAFSPPPPPPSFAPSPVNTRHRRSKSTSELWLDHHLQFETPSGTVMQPSGTSRKKSVTKLEVRDVTKNATNYMLTHQSTDPTSGALETQIFKADVIPSAGGGAAVIFNDVETIRQSSPTCSVDRKRAAAHHNKDKENHLVGRDCHNMSISKRAKESNL